MSLVFRALPATMVAASVSDGRSGSKHRNNSMGTHTVDRAADSEVDGVTGRVAPVTTVVCKIGDGRGIQRNGAAEVDGVPECGSQYRNSSRIIDAERATTG